MRHSRLLFEQHNTHLEARLAEIAVKKSRANEIAPLEHRVLEKCSAIGRRR
jgi:hypothetical protein